ncbi:aspartate aminotransferase family protein [Williamwhitmania taraxaci]|uniref:Acetylornithine/succinyldiaminopimelate/putrescine aminotransferase n=1 Tax=Williamwhitmania taraxaci TaxID=1640674 RepID=A0A1G6TBA8_9BACT|nr:aspartate aminotransferase family protein [Williamwhitmania taraxaci]SDD26134.1 Acetylornithine/succinyldiaminopimelate/putrescine aminotransferase [Williamwhitmania taraxaci]
MISLRNLFLQHVAQTSETPIGLEVERAEGIYIFDHSGRGYLDLISGVSVSSIGHCNPMVVDAVRSQAEKYMHLMVYGEYIQAPQVEYAKELTNLLPSSLSQVYFVNSGSEANEGALKLAKRFTGRTELVGFVNAYHGSTHGALSMMGDEGFKNAFRPLLPDTRHLPFNDIESLNQITSRTAAVLVEPIQGEAGAIVPTHKFLVALRNKCTETGALLIFDEVQTGFGRTGSLFAFQKLGVVPDIFTIAKGMGGGMPIGAFVSSKEIMECLKSNPILGHITTFGGHPVSCAAALATLRVLVENSYIEEVDSKEILFREQLIHPLIKEIRGIGLLLAVELGDAAMVQKVIRACFDRGIILDWFLFCDTAFRIAPPLIITKEQIASVCKTILEALDEVNGQL